MEKICLLLSGGVDSSVVAYELHRQGIHPDCYYIKIGPEDDKEWDCSSEEDLEMATAVARKYGCRLKVVDCHKEYWEQVTRYTMDKVRNGFTPNPDVMCNRLIKFGAFHEKICKDYDLIATGHYAQTEIIDGKKWLVTSPDPVKDQTDFLAQIYDWQLTKAVFLVKINDNDYIRRYLGEKPGEVLEYETGKLIGKHKGLWFHTIGQRHGLGFGGGPWFVVKKDMERNVLYVSKGYDPETAYKDELLIRDLHILTESQLAPDADGNVPTAVNITFKIRHTPEHHKAVLENLNDGTYLVHSEQKIHGVAPGQFCVIYDEEHHRCYGSGELAPGPQPPKGGVDSDADSDLDFGFDSGFKFR